MNHNGHHPPSVLIVDDEEMVITSLRALFELETDFTLHGFTDPEDWPVSPKTTGSMSPSPTT